MRHKLALFIALLLLPLMGFAAPADFAKGVSITNPSGTAIEINDAQAISTTGTSKLGAVSASNISATGNISAVKYFGDGGSLTNVGSTGISGSVASITTADITNLLGVNISGTAADIATLRATTVTATTINGQYASFTTLNVSSLTGLTGVSTTGGATLSATAVNAQYASFTTVTAGTYNGIGGGLTISPSWATAGLTLDQINYSNYVDVRQLGVICDGAAHSTNLNMAQIALNLAAIRPGITVNLAPKGFTCIYGTNTTTGVESPLKYLSNTTVLTEGTIKHNINNTDLNLLQGFYDAATASPTQRQYNVAVIGVPGNWWDTVSRTTLNGQSRKMLNIDNCTNCYVAGNFISLTTNIISYGIQLRNPENVLVERNIVRMFHHPANAAGGDAFHINADASGTVVRNNWFYGDDDGCSITEEGLANKHAIGTLFEGNTCSTYGYSSMKMFTDAAAAGSTIEGTRWIGNYFGIHGPNNFGGNYGDIYTDANGTGRSILNTTISDNYFDGHNGTRDNGSGAGSSFLMTSNDLCAVDGVQFNNNTFSGYQYRGMQIADKVCNIQIKGGSFVDYAGEHVIVSPSLVTSMTFNLTNQMRVNFDPAVSLTGVLTGDTQYVSVTAGTTNAFNFARFRITSVSTVNGDPWVIVDANGITSATDQVNASISASIVRRSGSAIYHRGVTNLVVDGVTFDDPPAATIIENSVPKPNNGIYRDNRVLHFKDYAAYQITAGWNLQFLYNQCIDSMGNFCIRESASSNVSNSIFIGNMDTGVSTTSRASFQLLDADHIAQWGNIGTNTDKFDFYAFNKVSASNVIATSATITTTATIGSISITTAKSSLLDVSVTGGVSVTGNVSAQSFVGTSARLTSLTLTGSATMTGISATNISATGNISALNFIGNGGSLTGITASGSGDSIISGTTKVTANSATSTISFTTAGTTSSYVTSVGLFVMPGISATTNQSSFTTIYAAGAVGIGTATPASSLTVVNGEVQLGTSGVACSGTNAGAVRYTASSLFFCDSSSWQPLATSSGGTNADRIVSGTTSILAQSGSGIISITTNGITSATISATGVFTMPGLNVQGSITATTIGVNTLNTGLGNSRIFFAGNAAGLLTASSNLTYTSSGVNNKLNVNLTTTGGQTLNVSGSAYISSWTIINGITPTAPLEVNGSISATNINALGVSSTISGTFVNAGTVSTSIDSISNFMRLASPTTAPSCTVVPDAVWRNGTTGCLNYCAGPNSPTVITAVGNGC